MKLLQSKYINKFSIAIAIFVIWITFIDNNSLFFQRKLDKEIKKIKKQVEFYKKEIEKEKKELKDLQNEQKLEKYARENLMLKKDNEDIFIIDKNNEK